MVSKNKFESAVNKFHKDLTKVKFKEYVKANLSFNVAKALRDLYYENQIIKIGLDTIKKILLKKKIATKKEIDKLIDELVVKKAKLTRKR